MELLCCIPEPGSLAKAVENKAGSFRWAVVAHMESLQAGVAVVEKRGLPEAGGEVVEKKGLPEAGGEVVEKRELPEAGMAGMVGLLLERVEVDGH
jgi:hypothetical protein